MDINYDREIFVETPERMIWLVHGAISTKECDKLVRVIPQAKKQPSELGVGLYARRTSKNCINTLEEFKSGRVLHHQLTKLILAESAFLHSHNAKDCTIEPIQVTVYNDKDEFALHLDQCTEDEIGCSEERREMGGVRMLSVILYLSDDFEGGNTFFQHHEIHVKPKKGTVLFFTNLLPNGDVDRYQLHAGEPVSKGTKMIAVTWTRIK